MEPNKAYITQFESDNTHKLEEKLQTDNFLSRGVEVTD